ncbi:hypothetical protein JXL19_07665 [bacterium]|nr:hypothetical protein [bacterium]
MQSAKQDIAFKGEALVCLKDQNGFDVVAQALDALNFNVSNAQTDVDALEKMKFNQYDIIIIEDGFGGFIEDDKVIKEIREMAPAQRRKCFVSLLGYGWETGDEMLAFSLSVNMTINGNDLGQLKDCLSQGIAHNQRFYKVYNDCRALLGRV